MITEAILDMLQGLATGLLTFLDGLVPAPPGFWADITTYVNTLVGDIAAPIRYFLPIGPLMGAAIVLVALIWTAAMMKLGRIVLSLITLGGGGVG